jgi:uncharacterized membrane protein
MKYNIAPYRVISIDILRGIVMIIMALDHTRDFFHITAVTANPLDMSTSTPLLYFTRWITHFCAPTFVFLSGVSAYLSSKKKTPAAASLFLMKRGVWLIVAELLIVTLAITFNPLYNVLVMEVLWAIGCSMIILALLSRISFKLVLIIGLLLFFGHNITDNPALTPSPVWQILFTARGTVLPLDSTHIILDLYAVLPWTGIMLLGYCAGYFYQQGMFTPEKRQRLLLLMGTSLILLFILLRFTNVYGDASLYEHGLFSFLNTSKYPPSLQYSCMTLGPALIALSLLENVTGKWSKIISIYGNVPFFYFVVHFYLLHSLLVITFFACGYSTAQIADPKSITLFRPASFGFSLPIVYLLWLGVVAAMYFPCRWLGDYKKTHDSLLLKYV